MANEHQKSNKKFYIVAGGFVAAVVLVLCIMLILKKPITEAADLGLGQESFQGPAEISTTVQMECQQAAAQVSRQASCADKETEFFKNTQNCMNVYYSLDDGEFGQSAEGNYGDLSLSIAKCYAIIDQSLDKARAILNKVAELPSWDIYMGPITCESKSAIEAYLESYATAPAFKCITTETIPSLITDLKNKNFSVLKNTISLGDIPSQGILEADVSCPEKFSSIEKTLQERFKNNLTVSDPKIEPLSTNDIFLELVADEKIQFTLQFKFGTQKCLHFESLLLPAEESGQ